MEDINKMLLMYLQEHGINARIPGHDNPYRHIRKGEPEKIIVNYKQADLGDAITISIMQTIMQTEIFVDGAQVVGREVRVAVSRQGRQDYKDVEIANLHDPQAFDRIRMWIRKEEKKLKYSNDGVSITERLKASAYGVHTKINYPEMQDEHVGITEVIHGSYITNTIKDFLEEEKDKDG